MIYHTFWMYLTILAFPNRMCSLFCLNGLSHSVFYPGMVIHSFFFSWRPQLFSNKQTKSGGTYSWKLPRQCGVSMARPFFPLLFSVVLACVDFWYFMGVFFVYRWYRCFSLFIKDLKGKYVLSSTCTYWEKSHSSGHIGGIDLFEGTLIGTQALGFGDYLKIWAPEIGFCSMKVQHQEWQRSDARVTHFFELTLCRTSASEAKVLLCSLGLGSALLHCSSEHINSHAMKCSKCTVIAVDDFILYITYFQCVCIYNVYIIYICILFCFYRFVVSCFVCLYLLYAV